MTPSQIRSVLVATALDARSPEILRQAARVAEAAGAELHVLHVREDGGSDEAGVEEGRERLAEQVEDVVGGEVSVDWSMRSGPARDRILERAREVSADLVVLGPNRKEGLKNRILGGTAESVVGDDNLSARVPVLVAGDRPVGASDRLLVAVDHSRWTAAVLAWGRSLAELTGAGLSVLHVFRPLYTGVASAVSGGREGNRLEGDQHRQAEAQLKEEIASAGADPEAVRVAVREGEPSKVILREVEEGSVGMVVMGSRGAGAAERVLVGSVAGDVIRGTDRPVLVVRETRGDA